MEVDMTEVKPGYISLLLTLIYRVLSVTNDVSVTEVRAFLITVPHVWNSLPQHVTSALSV